jgi:hypothetical protein
MYSGSESSHDARRAIAKRLSRVIGAHIVADAPPDHDAVVATRPRAPGWVRALVGASAVIGPWALVLLAAATLRR